MTNTPKCPVCGSNLVLNELFYELPVVGRVYIYSYTCEKCKFTKRDIQLLDIKEPRIYTFTVENSRDLYTKIIRAPTGKITLKEVGIEIIPGLIAEMFITNIEGLIYRIFDILKTAQRFREEENDQQGIKNIEYIRDYLNKVLEGKNRLTIIIEDPTGNSAIISGKAKIKKFKPQQ